MANMIMYIVRRILITIPMILALFILTWILAQIMPGDPTSSFPRTTPKETIALYRTLWHLDDPWYVQLGAYLRGIFQGDLGESVRVYPDQQVADILPRLVARSIELSLIPTLLIPIIGIKTALITVKHKDKWQDNLIRGFSVLASAIPTFFFALILQFLFGYIIPQATGNQFIDLPVIGLKTPGIDDPTFVTGLRTIDCLIANDMELFMDTVFHLILPVASQTILYFTGITRQTRSSMLEILDQDYIRTARAKGCSNEVVYKKHALRNALLPTSTLIISNAAWLVAGSVLIEITFSIRGMGLVLIEAVRFQDYWLLVGITTVIGTIIILGNLVADVVYTIIDPRIAYE